MGKRMMAGSKVSKEICNQMFHSTMIQNGCSEKAKYLQAAISLMMHFGFYHGRKSMQSNIQTLQSAPQPKQLTVQKFFQSFIE
jgi:hypothetical protein